MKKGNIFLVELPITTGHEQTGVRPAILLSEPVANIVSLIPVTSNIQALRFPYTLELKPSKKNGLSSLSVALVFHLRSVDTKRLTTKIGEIEESTLKEIDSFIKKLFALP